jgi:hypothetical protein
MKQIFEAWDDPDNNSIAFATIESINSQKSKGLISERAVFLYRVKADTWEEAMAVHHQKMGWEPYKPEGKPEICPNGCGGSYYPDGSGQCPNCGQIT